GTVTGSAGRGTGAGLTAFFTGSGFLMIGLGSGCGSGIISATSGTVSGAGLLIRLTIMAAASGFDISSGSIESPRSRLPNTSTCAATTRNKVLLEKSDLSAFASLSDNNNSS